MSKQAAGKTAERLEALGYVERIDDVHDARRKLVRLTPHGVDAPVRSAQIFEELRAEWAKTLGPQRLREMEAGLRTVTPGNFFRLDAPGWFSG